MSSESTSFSFNLSAASSNKNNGDDVDTAKVKNHVKDLLRSRIFLGRYLERRLCDERTGYRDVVLLSSAEVELKRDLIEVQHKLRSVYPDTHWIGITEGQHIGYSGLLLWTEIDNKPFGTFWFQIKSIKFRDNEVIVIVKCIRNITDAYLEVEPILTGAVKKKSIAATDNTNASYNNATETLNDTFNEFLLTLKGALSIRNVKEFVTFLCAFVIAVFTGSSAFINFLGNFVLALIREMSHLIKSSTPLFLGFLDFLSKIVGGFYILVAMVFKPSNPVHIDRRSIAHQDKNKRVMYNSHSHVYDDTSFD